MAMMIYGNCTAEYGEWRRRDKKRQEETRRDEERG